VLEAVNRVVVGDLLVEDTGTEARDAAGLQPAAIQIASRGIMETIID
jgi:hypothetical protein